MKTDLITTAVVNKQVISIKHIGVGLLLLAAPALMLLEKEEEVRCASGFVFFIWIIIGKRLPLLQSYIQEVISILSKLSKTNMPIHLKLFSQSSKLKSKAMHLSAICILSIGMLQSEYSLIIGGYDCEFNMKLFLVFPNYIQNCQNIFFYFHCYNKCYSKV